MRELDLNDDILTLDSSNLKDVSFFGDLVDILRMENGELQMKLNDWRFYKSGLEGAKLKYDNELGYWKVIQGPSNPSDLTDRLFEGDYIPTDDLKEFGVSTESISRHKDNQDLRKKLYNLIEKKVTELNTKQYDTGGYTGAWGPEGRLAILHQKELVLNAADTANFLASMEIMRSIANQIDLRAAAMASSNGLPTLNYQGAAQTLQQEVHIQAEFPNATNHQEIEEAFGNLVNMATQYANRKI